MFTKEQINKILEPWDSSIDERPVPTRNDFAYDESARDKATQMALRWQDEHLSPFSDAEMYADFICHQSDVIEMLAHALSFANKRIEDKQDIIEILEDQVSMLQE